MREINDIEGRGRCDIPESIHHHIASFARRVRVLLVGVEVNNVVQAHQVDSCSEMCTIRDTGIDQPRAGSKFAFEERGLGFGMEWGVARHPGVGLCYDLIKRKNGCGFEGPVSR